MLPLQRETCCRFRALSSLELTWCESLRQVVGSKGPGFGVSSGKLVGPVDAVYATRFSWLVGSGSLCWSRWWISSSRTGTKSQKLAQRPSSCFLSRTLEGSGVSGRRAMASNIARVGLKRSMRIYALPLTSTRTSVSAGHKEHLTYYHFVNPPPPEGTRTDWVQWATNKASGLWADFGKAPEGHWKVSTYTP